MTYLLLASCAAPAHVLVLTHSGQRRQAPPFDCASCDTLDLAAPREVNRSYDIAVLDGHSLPGSGFVGVTDEALLDVLADADPVHIVAATCYAAEIGFLSKVFARLPRLETVRAAPEVQPWSLSAPAPCLADDGAPTAACIPISPEAQVYDRATVAALAASAERSAREQLEACARPPHFVRLHPHLLCVRDGTHSALLHVDPGRIDPRCVAGPPSRLVDVRCEPDRHVAPVPPAAGG